MFVFLGLIRDNSTILVHSKCSCVLEVIRAAANPSLPSPKHFSVIIVSAATTPAAVDEEEDMVRKVRQLGLPTRLISQAAVGFEMEKVDIVLVKLCLQLQLTMATAPKSTKIQRFSHTTLRLRANQVLTND